MTCAPPVRTFTRSALQALIEGGVPDLIIIIAGPNGTGKTTFASAYFHEEERFVFVNADEFARDLAELDIPEPQRDIRKRS